MEFKCPVPTTDYSKNDSKDLLSPNSTLYCTYTHLVCRHALPGPKVREEKNFFYPINANPVAKVREKTDLSHEVHADNCTVSGAFCDPSPPAYSYRSISALLYLSSLHKQFKGGRFFFADRHPGGKAFTPTSIVDPGCGRLLAFTSGPENLHGVMPVAAGTRFLTPKCFPST